MHPSDSPSLENLDTLFTYHPPGGDQAARYSAINTATKEAARVILTTCPPSADRDNAVNQLRQSRMLANASIACSTPDQLPPLR